MIIVGLHGNDAQQAEEAHSSCCRFAPRQPSQGQLLSRGCRPKSGMTVFFGGCCIYLDEVRSVNKMKPRLRKDAMCLPPSAAYIVSVIDWLADDGILWCIKDSVRSPLTETANVVFIMRLLLLSIIGCSPVFHLSFA